MKDVDGRVKPGHDVESVMDGPKPTRALAAFAANLDPATLPAEVRQKLGWLLLDYLRVCSIGARLPWSDWARSYVGLVGRAGSSHVLFAPERLNPQHATFLNVTFGSSFDADDTHVGAMLHPGVAVWSAALAIGEHAGASGKRIAAAHAAQSGVAAALLTQQGFSGPADIIEGAGGFARAYGDGWDPAIIERGLGERFHLMDVLVKSHASAARVAAAIDGMLALRQQHCFTGDDIETAHVGIPRVIAGRLTNVHPVDLQAAQMCLPFSVALAAKISMAADLV